MKLFQNKFHFLPPLVLIIAYSALPNRHAMHDAIYYAEVVESGTLQSPLLWHPSHLLYGPLGYILYNCLQRVGMEITPFHIYTTVGIITSSLLVFFFGLLLALSQISYKAIALTLLMWISSYVAWHCSTSSDLARNVIPVFFVVAAFFTTAHGTRNANHVWPYLTGILLGLAGLFHILAVWAVPSLFFFIWKLSDASKFRKLLSVFLSAGAIVSLVYSLVALRINGIKNVSAFLSWFSSPGGAEWVQPSLFHGILDLGLTAARSVFGSVTYQPLKSAFLSFGAEHADILILAFASLVILTHWSFIILRSMNSPVGSESTLTKAMLIWLCCHALFAIFYDPGNIRMVLYLSVPFTALIAEAIKSRPFFRYQLGAMVLTVISLIIFNMPVLVKESRPQTQRAYELLASMNDTSQDPHDLFLVTMGTDAAYARYFGKRKAIAVGTRTFSKEKVLSFVERSQSLGHKVFVASDLIEKMNGNDGPEEINLKDLYNRIGKPSVGSDERFGLLIKHK